MQKALSFDSHRDRWLALLAAQEIGRPRMVRVLETPGAMVQLTVGEPPGQLSLEALPAHVLMFNLSPVLTLEQHREGRWFRSDVLRGEMTLMPRGIPSRWLWKSACDRMDVVLPADVLDDGTELDLVDRFLFRDREVETTCRSIYRAMSIADQTDLLYLESLVAQLAIALLERHSNTSRAKAMRSTHGLTRIQSRQVAEYVEAHLSGVLSLRGLAQIAGLSPYHFSRMFLRTMGIPPYQYVLERRVERAKALLWHREANLAEVGLAAGFSGQSHFTSAFHRLVGTTPLEFQKLMRSDV